MSKSILVIDTPENCTECPLTFEIGDTKGKTLLNANICRGCGQRNMDSMTKPDWCPLKDVPKKKPFNEELIQGIGIRKRINIVLHEAAALGWNACIDEILGGGVNRMDNEKYCIELAKHCIGLGRKKPYVRHGKKFYRPYRNFCDWWKL